MQNIERACFTALDSSVNNAFKVSNDPTIRGWHTGMRVIDILDQLSATYMQPTPSALEANNLGWESRQHVGNMLARQPNVGTFGRHPPVVATQNQSRHSIFVSWIANIHPICILVPELHTKNSSVRFVGNI